MRHISVILAATKRKHPSVMPHWLLHLGLLGVFGVSLLDSSIIPLPIPGSTDLLILLLAAHHGNPYLLALAGISGSILGGYLTWGTGKKGGEAILEHYVRRRFLSPIKGWVKDHGILAVMAAALLPPPIPLMPFLLAAGALGISWRKFVFSLAAARTIRYGLMAWLGVHYGHPIVRIWAHYMATGWARAILWTAIAVMVSGVLYGFWKYRHGKQSQSSQPAAATAD